MSETSRVPQPAAAVPQDRWELDVAEKPWDQAPFDNEPPIAGCGFEERLRIKRVVDQAMLDRAGLADLDTLIDHDTFPIPSQKDREGYAPFAWRYWASGLVDFAKVLTAAHRHGIQSRRVFDFGCASGRVLRHFVVENQFQSPSQRRDLWGSDLNYRHIRWLEAHLPEIKAVFNPAIPSLPLEDRSFDLVTAFSVFTHLDTFESTWLCELRRVLSPGGLAYITVHNEATWEDLRAEAGQGSGAVSRHYQSLLAADPEIDKKLAGEMPAPRLIFRFARQGPYTSQVFHTTAYLRQVWGRFFEILEILPRYHFHQTVVLMRKPT